jgi:hypothetical protein
MPDQGCTHIGAIATIKQSQRYVLRQLPESPRNQARASDRASGHRLGGAGRALAVLLSGRSRR